MKKLILILLVGLTAAEVMAGTTDNLLKIYAMLADKTILRPGSLPELPSTIISQIPKDKTNAVIFIEDQLKTNQLDMVRDGTKFVMILPTGWQNSALAKELNRLQTPPTNDVTAPSFPARFIYFQDLRLDAFLEIYSKIRGRAIVRPSPLPDVVIDFQTQMSLTKDELVHALDVVLTLNGIATIDEGDKFVKVIPVESAKHTQ